MISYVYRLTCKPINKHYIGSRKNKCFETDFWKIYFTSSKVVKSLIETYGVSSDVWEFEKLSEHDTYQKAVNHENLLLSSISEKQNYLNLNFSANGAVIMNSSYRKICVDGVLAYWPKYSELPKNAVDASKWNTPPSQKGKRNWINPYTLDRRLSHNDLSLNGYILLTEYTKQKNKRPKIGMVWCNDGNINKKLYPNEVPIGWCLGRCKSIRVRKQRIAGSTTNKRCYTNGVRNIFIGHNDEVPDGFYLGLTRGNNDNNRKNE